jgi:dihydroneopterin aldolase/2-amino-4-hydroxy-6-hydroxymethyldihydropteridine diphosphokinase
MINGENQTHYAYISLGTNVGNKKENLVNAINHISEENEIIKKSSLYKTEPWGNKEQDSFINQVIYIKTNMSSHKLMAFLLSTEKKMGRERKEKWGPRIIDLDILFYENEIINEEELTIPHPHITERKFILVPLMEISETIKHPLTERTIKWHVEVCSDKNEVIQI